MTSGSSENLGVLAMHGMRHLFVRQIFTTVTTLAGGVILARVLSPAEFGTYAIATFIVNIFMIFGDLGLGPAFIQSTTAPSHEDLQMSFTVQFCLVTAVVLLTWSFAPWIIRFYPAIGESGIRLARVLSLLLYIPLFRSNSAIQLERTLNFRPIAWAEGIAIFLYQLVAVICALSGFGVWSFVLATFAAGISGCLVIYHAAPWPIRLRFNSAEMYRILKQGISFQCAPIVDVISQWATPAIVGTLLGPAAVGYIGLALANARRPLLLAESVMRVSFPHFSRLQEDTNKLQETINDYLLGFLWVMMLWTGFLWSSSSPLVAIVYSPKWAPAVPAMVIFAMALPLDMIIWMMGLSYRATNQNWSALNIFGTRTVLNLALAVLLVPRLGFVGIPWAYLVADFVCAVLLLRGFAAGLTTIVVRRSWWLVPSVVSGYLCSRLSTGIFATHGNVTPIQQFVASALPFLTVYLVISAIFAPRQYRDRFLASAREVLFSRRQEGRATLDTFARIHRYHVVPHPESLGCAASED
jgi:O-antigen/teichoic acid export membrane protein